MAPDLPRDRHVRRGADDYAVAFANLLPVGRAWPRDPDSVLMGFVAGQAAIWGDVDDRAADLLETETDPRVTTEMVEDWERAFGLPDPCLTPPSTLTARRKAIVDRMVFQGGQSRAFFIGVALGLGYTITIREFSPYMCGVSRCGWSPYVDGYPRWQLASPLIRFVWVVRITGRAIRRFRVGHGTTGYGGGQVGVDPLLHIARLGDLECLFRRYKPGQTEVVFRYEI